MIAIAAIAMPATRAVAATGAPVRLRVSEGFSNPIGFYDATPTFSWQLPADGSGKSQSAYRLSVASAERLLGTRPDIWDSGKVTSDRSVWVPYAGRTLVSGQKVFWRVKFWDERGRESEWSAPATFELGLLENSDWTGKWVRMGAAKTIPTEIAPAKDAPKIEVRKALYGVRGDPAKQVDLTRKLQRQVAGGDCVVSANNDTAGRDPAYGVVKTLELEYTVDGKLKKRSLRENVKLDLATGSSASSGKTKGGRFVPEYLRREFALAGGVRSARLHVTAKGVYEVRLNGKKIGEDFMAPGWTPYHKRIEVITYDVTDMVRRGANAIGAVVGEGWYAGAMMRKRFVYPAAKPMLLVQLEITLADGSTKTVVTDESWKATNRGPVRYSSIYNGEVYDARMEMPKWSEVGFDDSAWSDVISEDVAATPPLVPKRHYPVRETEELPTIKVSEPAKGQFVFDLGQNMVGLPRVAIPVREGAQVKVRFAEMLEKNGTLYTANYRAAHSTAYYTPAKTGNVTWSPTFTFFGFRYVELSGLPEGARPKADWVTGVVLHSAFPRSGSFSSSHELMNKLQKNIIWGQRGNYLDIPTDCPQRDERLGWTGDAQVFCPTSLFNYDVLSFWMSWLQSVREEQNARGLIPHVVPDTGCGHGSPGWGDVAVASPWDVYVRTGHRRVLEENYDMMAKWTAAYEGQAKDFIVDRKGYGDWLVPYGKGTDKGYIATAYFGRCAATMEKAATVLGKQDEAARYAKLHADVRAAVSKKYFDGTGKLHKETQTAYLMALGYDLLEPGLREGAVANLLEVIEKAGGHLGTGFLGTPLIALVLDKEGHSDVSYKVVFKETYPSWFYSIHQGATTMWERWNSYSHDKGFGNAGMNSFNHYAYGAVGQWMYERIAGLAPDPERPGYKHFFIQPNPGGPLRSARAELETPYGRAASGWEKKGRSLVIRAVVPPNTTATLVVPAQGARKPTVLSAGRTCEIVERDGKFVYDIGPGRYQFTMRQR
jgi:alpha-L-rhamnosidase